MNNKHCRECPWKNTNKNSLKFREFSNKMKSIGVKIHACHMITSDIWGYKNKIDSNTLCRGQNLNNNNGE